MALTILLRVSRVCSCRFQKTGSVWFEGASGGSAFSAKNLGLESFTLGGPFRLGAYGINELIGNQYLLFQGGYSYRIASFNPLFGGAVYALAWYEAGKMYGDPAGPGGCRWMVP